MRFALLGEHPDGLDMGRALAESGRHELAIYSGPVSGAEHLRRGDLNPVRVGDLEEVLADPRIEAVIVAGGPANRAAQLRRALQSERHVMCVHPLDGDPNSAYEAAMLQADTRQVLLPLLPMAMHPGICRLAKLARSTEPAPAVSIRDLKDEARPGFLRLIQMEVWSDEKVLLDIDSAAHDPGLPGWEVLRTLGGDISEVAALAWAEELPADEPIILSGMFANRGLFQAILLPNQPESRWRLTLLTRAGRSELVFPQGWPGPARLSGIDERGAELSESWESWNPWSRMVEVFEEAVAANRQNTHPSGRAPALRPRVQDDAITADLRHVPLPERPFAERRATPPLPLAWQDEIRCLELDDAARRSVARRRTSTLEYQEASEEAGFKGTMTLVGCSLLWLSLLFLIMSIWVPWLGWLIIPVFAFFLLLQMLRWVVPGRSPSEPDAQARARAARIKGGSADGRSPSEPDAQARGR